MGHLRELFPRERGDRKEHNLDKAVLQVLWEHKPQNETGMAQSKPD